MSATQNYTLANLSRAEIQQIAMALDDRIEMLAERLERAKQCDINVDYYAKALVATQSAYALVYAI